MLLVTPLQGKTIFMWSLNVSLSNSSVTVPYILQVVPGLMRQPIFYIQHLYFINTNLSNLKNQNLKLDS